MTLMQELRAYAKARGLDLVGCASAEPFLRGAQGERVDPRETLAEARSVVVAACYVYGFERPEPSAPGAPRGRFGPWTRASKPAAAHGAATVSAFLEQHGFRAAPGMHLPLKMAAVRSGIAQYGKNCIVHADGYGSYLELSAVVTDADLGAEDRPIETSDCGDCVACLEACPTGALREPYGLEMGRRICAWLWGRPIPREDRGKPGNLVHRCHYCQEVCPKNQALTPRPSWPFELDGPTDTPELIPLLVGSEKEQAAALPGFVMSAGSATIRRNVAMALGNCGDRAAVPALAKALGVEDAPVRAMAAWAVGRLGGEEAREALTRALAGEQDRRVRGEIEAALADALEA